MPVLSFHLPLNARTLFIPKDLNASTRRFSSSDLERDFGLPIILE